MKKQTIEQATELVKQSFPSIFTKENVIELLESIEKTALTDEQKEMLKSEAKGELKDEIMEAIDNFHFDDDNADVSSAKFSLSRNEINLDSVELDSDSIKYQLKREFENLFN